MLVKFDSSVGALTMFGDVAAQLIKMMGHSGAIPSAILAADLPQAIAKLETALAAMPPDARPADQEPREENSAKVSLRLRAHPLIELMRRAARADADLLWDNA
jgi:hypothetical protein